MELSININDKNDKNDNSLNKLKTNNLTDRPKINDKLSPSTILRKYQMIANNQLPTLNNKKESSYFNQYITRVNEKEIQ